MAVVKGAHMIARVEGNMVTIYDEYGHVKRRIGCRIPVSSAYVSGDRVNVQLSDGHVEIYDLYGHVIRRM